MVPIIVYCKIDTLDYQTYLNWVGNRTEMDLFAYYKVLFTIQMTFLLTITYLLRRKKNERLNDVKEYRWIYIYIICVIISFILSSYKEIALFGFVYRYEGSILLISYFIILYITINIFDYDFEHKKVLYSIMISYIIVAIVGISQYLDSDIVTTNFMQNLIIPNKYSQLIGTLKGSSKASQKVAGLIGNANYFAQYYAVIAPIFITLFIYSKDKKEKILYGLISLIGVIVVIMSLSEAAMISLVIILIILFIINIKRIMYKLGKKKMIIFMTIISLLFIFDFYLKGPVSSKALFIISKIEYELNPVDEKILLQEIKLNGNTAIMKSKNREILIKSEKEKILVKYDNDEVIDLSKKKVILKNGIIIELKKHNYTNRDIVYIQVDNNVQFRMIVDKGEFKFINDSNNIIEQDKIEVAFGDGIEEFLTGRMYIWSRAIPKVMQRPLFGYGADTFELVFPNYDYAGLYKTFRRNRIIVDKPHNIYIGIASNTGIIALISFLMINILYIKDSVTSLKKYGIKSSKEAYRLGILMSIISYLMLGIMYDSNIVSTVMYYILLGIGINLNYKERNKNI